MMPSFFIFVRFGFKGATHYKSLSIVSFIYVVANILSPCFPVSLWAYGIYAVAGVHACVFNVLTPPLFTSFASTLNRLISIQPMQMRPGERRLCNICSSSFAARASELGTGAGPLFTLEW